MSDLRAPFVYWTADPNIRIVLCGYNSDHDELLEYGWRKMEMKSASGYSGKLQNRERIWCSPSCLSELTLWS